MRFSQPLRHPASSLSPYQCVWSVLDFVCPAASSSDLSLVIGQSSACCAHSAWIIYVCLSLSQVPASGIDNRDWRNENWCPVSYEITHLMTGPSWVFSLCPPTLNVHSPHNISYAVRQASVVACFVARAHCVYRTLMIILLIPAWLAEAYV